jgi:hypothetical protein
MEGISKREAHRGGQNPKKIILEPELELQRTMRHLEGSARPQQPLATYAKPSYVKIFPVAGHQDGLHSRALSLTKP